MQPTDPMVCMTLFLLTQVVPLALGIPTQSLGKQRVCYPLPGDEEWPSIDDWDQLNATTNGRLIRGTPLAASCFTPNLDEAACNETKRLWTDISIR